jgi:hypothetical protein
MMARGIKREQIGNHADPRDTSQMMAGDPTMVRNSKIVAADGKNCIQGDPRGSTAGDRPRPHRHELGAYRRPHSSIHRGAMGWLTVRMSSDHRRVCDAARDSRRVNARLRWLPASHPSAARASG